MRWLIAFALPGLCLGGSCVYPREAVHYQPVRLVGTGDEDVRRPPLPMDSSTAGGVPSGADGGMGSCWPEPILTVFSSCSMCTFHDATKMELYADGSVNAYDIANRWYTATLSPEDVATVRSILSSPEWHNLEPGEEARRAGKYDVYTTPDKEVVRQAYGSDVKSKLLAREPLVKTLAHTLAHLDGRFTRAPLRDGQYADARRRGSCGRTGVGEVVRARRSLGAGYRRSVPD